jgi:hypothetical protein
MANQVSKEDRLAVLESAKAFNQCVAAFITVMAGFVFLFAIGGSYPDLIPLIRLVLVGVQIWGAYSYYTGATRLRGKPATVLTLVYLFVPCGNIGCIVDLTKGLNTFLEPMGVQKIFAFADIAAIEKKLQED